MSSFLEKLGSYHILTNLLPGAFFMLTSRGFFGIGLPTANVAEDIVVFYFVGLIINRIGSLIVEPALKRCSFVKFAPHADYIKAVSIDSKIDVLSETNILLRTLLTCVILLPIIKLADIMYSKFPIIMQNFSWVIIILLIALFLFAFKKQSDYIRKRVEAVNSQPAKDK